MLAIFENYSQSSFTSPNKDCWPVEVQMNQFFLQNALTEYFKKNEYIEIQYLEGPREIFAKKDDFEVCFHMINQNPTTIRVLVSVFSETKIGKTRKYMKKVLADLRELFNVKY